MSPLYPPNKGSQEDALCLQIAQGIWEKQPPTLRDKLIEGINVRVTQEHFREEWSQSRILKGHFQKWERCIESSAGRKAGTGDDTQLWMPNRTGSTEEKKEDKPQKGTESSYTLERNTSDRIRLRQKEDSSHSQEQNCYHETQRYSQSFLGN